MRTSIWLLGAVLLSACGPAGVLSGKVTVEGGSAADIAVIIYGPQSAATVTGEDGLFSIGNLPDGKYVVRATVRGADVEELSVSTTITNAVSSPEPILAFRASTAKVTGRVVMADGSGPENLTVTATGVETRGARTAPDGSFSFDNLKTGPYLISVEARDTLEGRVGMGVNASGPVDVGELRLTPVGRFNGTVEHNGMPVADAPVVVTGTSLAATTDAMGRFFLANVPTGNQTVQVRVGSEPFYRSGLAMVMVARGANADVAITLSDDPPKTGTVTGTVTFHGPRSPRDISVFAPGTLVSTSPQANGAFSLTLPVGTWEVMASAPQHPPKLLGRVTVTEGQVQALTGSELSWYREIWRSTPAISAPAPVAMGLNDNVPWSLVRFTDNYERLALVNSTTYDFRILALGTSQGHRISKAGKFAGWYVNGTAFVYDIGTATLSTFTALPNITRIEFSSDESAIFIQRVGPTLSRIKFAASTMVEVFPPTGNAADIQATNVDRWFVRDSTDSITLVTPLTEVVNAFTAVGSFNAQPTGWALTNCAVACQLWVLGPTSTSPALRVTAVNPPPGGLGVFQSSALQSRDDYPCFNYPSTTTAFCVRSSDATHIPLAAVPITFELNEAGDRVIWTLPSGLNYAVREEAMPPVLSTLNLATSAQTWQSGWISPTRAYAYQTSGSPRSLHLIKSGVGTVDMDIAGQTITQRPPALVFPQLSTAEWRVIIGDGPMRTIPVPTSTNLALTVRPLGTGPTAVTRYAAVSSDQVSSYFLDENAGSVRPLPLGYSGSSAAFRSGAIEYALITRLSGGGYFHVFNTTTALEFLDTSTNIVGQVGAPGVQAWIAIGDDQRTISLGGFQP